MTNPLEYYAGSLTMNTITNQTPVDIAMNSTNFDINGTLLSATKFHILANIRGISVIYYGWDYVRVTEQTILPLFAMAYCRPTGCDVSGPLSLDVYTLSDERILEFADPSNPIHKIQWKIDDTHIATQGDLTYRS